MSDATLACEDLDPFRRDAGFVCPFCWARFFVTDPRARPRVARAFRTHLERQHPEAWAVKKADKIRT